MKENQLEVYREDGTTEILELLFSFSCDTRKKDYVVFQDSTGEFGAMEYEETESGEGGNLAPIEDESVFELLEEKLEKYLQECGENIEENTEE